MSDFSNNTTQEVSSSSGGEAYDFPETNDLESPMDVDRVDTSNSNAVAGESSKSDANDYSRFNKVVDMSDSDSELNNRGDSIKPIFECIVEATGHKDIGNTAFKSSKYKDAKVSYDMGISALKAHSEKKPPEIDVAEYNDINALLVSLHGNMAMVQIKEEEWSAAIKSASEVLKIEPHNIKSLYRRGTAYNKLGNLDKSKADLMKTIELDPNNAPAKKELNDVIKSLKEHAKKDKAVYSSIFTKTSMYDDKEREREEKKRKEARDREIEQDEWTKSKISRREQGLEEQTFDQWKEEKEKAQKAIEEARKETERQKEKEARKQRKKEEKTHSSSNDEEYDEEESKIISETAKKGYCYFNRKLAAEEQSLIGDISPKTVHKGSTTSETTVGSQSHTTPITTPSPITNNDSKVISASSWNHAGTWEERDLTNRSHDWFKSKLTVVEITCEDITEDIPVKCLGKVIKVDSIDGDAQIVLARQKKRHIFDFNITVDYEVTIEPVVGVNNQSEETDVTHTALKTKTFLGSLKYADITPNSHVNGHISVKKTIPSTYKKPFETAINKLKEAIQVQIEMFEIEFKNM
mmetsp:Transcript_41133/g.42030  ORF Transcript_41133/g.42030 Transcript_41133/m.42030 type:complete len:579 (+) Transcript_41133:59-1795(+)|eukprot:CAMPEP_0182428906 /NCGR_PEP_ID=MMETSP1167-20130531/24493_1 /TAXON_ID=2988 /ORGANISM="Mallomonas Sp, Strain CCMP3275" /LENGTH=578 /DNA_ID=CAMNT_0024612115 /DNA_START=58 /DNA_END=1794 /DNA_ORIENTATION=+